MTMNLVQALRNCLAVKYCSTKGRASRSEYWWFLLCATIAGSVLESISDGGGGLAIAAGLASLALVPPQICLTSRRLHDIGLSGWWQLLPFLLAILGLMSLPFDTSGVICILGVLGGMFFGLYFGLRRGTAPGVPNPYGLAPDGAPVPPQPEQPAEAFRIEEEEEKPVLCPNCGRAFAEGDKFCGGCGQAFPEAPCCPDCGHVLEAESRFCTHCGRKLGEEAQTEQA